MRLNALLLLLRGVMGEDHLNPQGLENSLGSRETPIGGVKGP